MRRLATRRLVDAAATLNAADQALLNIWINRGLDDAALARMTRMSQEAIADRRGRIVEHLSLALGLPPDHIRSELNEIAVAPEVHPAAIDDPPAAAAGEPEAPADAAGGNGAAPPELIAPMSDGPAPPAVGETSDIDAKAPVTEPAAREPGARERPASERPASEPPAGSSSLRRRPVWSGVALLLCVVVAVVVIVALTSGGSGQTPRPAAAAARTAPTRPTTGPSPSPAAGGKLARRLVALAGGADHAAGSIVILRQGPTRRLALSVSNLPAALHGHYEVWLYNSLTYSEDLGRLRNGVRHLLLRLPANAGRYQWIDISFQPVGYVFNSGESILRSTNPLFTKSTPSSP